MCTSHEGGSEVSSETRSTLHKADEQMNVNEVKGFPPKQIWHGYNPKP